MKEVDSIIGKTIKGFRGIQKHTEMTIDQQHHFTPTGMKKEENGIVWYTEEFLKNQIKLAEQNGFIRGVRIEFHSVQPPIEVSTDDLKEQFKSFCFSKIWKE